MCLADASIQARKCLTCRSFGTVLKGGLCRFRVTPAAGGQKALLPAEPRQSPRLGASASFFGRHLSAAGSLGPSAACCADACFYLEQGRRTQSRRHFGVTQAWMQQSKPRFLAALTWCRHVLFLLEFWSHCCGSFAFHQKPALWGTGRHLSHKAAGCAVWCSAL